MGATQQFYISEDLSLAPAYDLAQNIDKNLPQIEPDLTKSEYLNALAEISAYQIFEDIPGIRKNRLVLDAGNSFEIWEPIPNRVLLKADLDFLRQDSQRVVAIASKLIWLGYACLNSELLEQKLKIETWQDASDILESSGYDYDLITIETQPARIILETRHDDCANEYWGIYPPCWQINLNKTRTFNGGYVIDSYNTPYHFNIAVWLGMPFLRNIQTGEIEIYITWCRGAHLCAPTNVLHP